MLVDNCISIRILGLLRSKFDALIYIKLIFTEQIFFMADRGANLKFQIYFIKVVNCHKIITLD
jgi:hypothetical protein